MEIAQLVMQIVIFVIISFLALYIKKSFASYADEKGRNQATKEDIGKITREIENVRTEYTKDIVQLRSDLIKEQHRHTVKFQHEFKILTELWANVEELQNCARALRPEIDSHKRDETDEDRKESRLKAFSEAAQKAADTIRNNKPFYPKSIYEQVDGLYKVALHEAISYKHGKVDSDDFFEKGRKNADKIVELVEILCEKIRERIDPESRLQDS